MMPITASTPIDGAHFTAACGRNGMAMRTKPYVPSFSRIAARITEPCVGAWVWASGSQVWNGNIGTLTAKPMNMPAKIQTAVFVATPPPCSMNHWNSKLASSASAVVLGQDEQGDERHQHQRRTEHRVEEELQRRVLALLAAPHADHEVHRQQHELEEDEEQDQVLGDERAGHAGLQDQHQDEERLRVARRRDVVPRVDHHQQGDDHRQEVERQADAVEADRVVGVDRPDPRRGGEELQLAGLAVVELDQRVRCRPPAWPAAVRIRLP